MSEKITYELLAKNRYGGKLSKEVMTECPRCNRKIDMGFTVGSYLDRNGSRQYTGEYYCWCGYIKDADNFFLDTKSREILPQPQNI
jgi:hypothetical protein